MSRYQSFAVVSSDLVSHDAPQLASCTYLLPLVSDLFAVRPHHHGAVHREGGSGCWMRTKAAVRSSVKWYCSRFFFISCRIRRLSMSQSLSCLVLSTESANNRLSSVQFGEKEEHYLRKIKKKNILDKKKKFFLWLWLSAPLLHLLPFLPLLPNTNLSISANRRLSAVQLGEKEERILEKKKNHSKKKCSFFDSNAQLILYITFHFFLFPSTFNLVYSRVSTAHLGQKEENNLSQKQKICKRSFVTPAFSSSSSSSSSPSSYIPLSAQCYRLQASHLSLQLDENEEHFSAKIKKLSLPKKRKKSSVFDPCV